MTLCDVCDMCVVRDAHGSRRRLRDAERPCVEGIVARRHRWCRVPGVARRCSRGARRPLSSLVRSIGTARKCSRAPHRIANHELNIESNLFEQQLQHILQHVCRYCQRCQSNHRSVGQGRTRVTAQHHQACHCLGLGSLVPRVRASNSRYLNRIQHSRTTPICSLVHSLTHSFIPSFLRVDWEPRPSYAQGMNSMAGLLLYTMCEVDAFYCFLRIYQWHIRPYSVLDYRMKKVSTKMALICLSLVDRDLFKSAGKLLAENLELLAPRTFVQV